MPVQFGGLVSGMDTNSMISQLVSLEKIPINKLNNKKATMQTDIRTIGTLSTKIKSLETAAKDLATAQDFVSHKTTSTNDSAVKVTASAGASASNYDVEVTQLAGPAKMRSGAFGSASDVMSAGTMNLGVFGEDAVSIEIPAGSTLTQVRDLIRASGAKVDASIVDSGNGVYLSVTGQKSGHEIGGLPADALTFGFTPSGVGGGQDLVMATTQAAKNAKFSVDGLDIERSTNIVDDAVEGLSFALGAITTSPAAIQVSVDNEAIMEKVKVFVDAYNGAVDQIKKQSDAGNKRRATDDFRTAASQANVGGEFGTLASLGLGLSSTGKMEFDTDVFTAALNKDTDAVANVFADPSGVAARLQTQVDRYTGSSGILDSLTDSYNTGIDRIDGQVERKTLSLDKYETRIRRQFSMLEQLLVDLNDQSNSYAALLGTSNNQ
jgi:flagellar hook-associated protein 2